MSKTIWKFKIETGYTTKVNAYFFINAPTDIKILSVDKQHNIYYIWGVVNTNNPIVKKQILIRETGQDFEGSEGNFIGTVISPDGTYVLHFFDSDD